MNKQAVLASLTLVGVVSLSACTWTFPGLAKQSNVAGYNFLTPESPSAQNSAKESVGQESSSDAAKIKNIQVPVETFRQMPNLIGVSFNDALEEITEHFSKTTLQIDNQAEVGTECSRGLQLVVVSQVPAKGSKVANGPRSHIKIVTKCQVPSSNNHENDTHGAETGENGAEFESE